MVGGTAVSGGWSIPTGTEVLVDSVDHRTGDSHRSWFLRGTESVRGRVTELFGDQIKE